MHNVIIRKLIMLSVGFWCLLALLSGLLNSVSVSSSRGNQTLLSDIAVPEIDTATWRNVVKNITAYEPKITKAELEAQKAAEEAAEKERLAKLAQQKELTLADARLVGTVLTSPAKALLVLPDGAEPNEFRIGESWLSQWVLSAINADYVVWQHAETKDTQQQALFQ